MNQKSVSQLILEQLKVYGVKRIYGVVGDAILGLMDAITKQSEIKFIAVKHESVAAMMASAEAKLTGGIGVCAATSGPGITNLLNGLGDAYSDKAPVLAITGQVPSTKIGTDYKQFVDQQELIKPFASYSSLLAHPDAVIDILSKALHKSLVKGAVTHISVPKDMFTMASTAQIKQKPTLLRGITNFEESGLQPAIDIMNTAQRPIILAGVGSRNASKTVEELAEKWGAGILVSLGAKGFIPDTSPHLLGAIGQGGNPYAPSVFKNADVVLLAGDTWWPEGYVPQNARIIQIDFMHENIGKGIPVELGIVGDAGEVLPLLTNSLNGRTNENWMDEVKKAKSTWDIQNEQEGNQIGSPIHPARIVRSIENAVADDAIITLDTGDVTVWMNRNFRPKQQFMLFSGDWRTMGYGLPAALAAKLCAPEKQVISVVGDGGLEMTLADLITAVRYKIDINIIVFNNQALQMERDKMIVDGLLQQGVDLTNPDFVKVAEACGLKGYKVETEAELEEILKLAISTNGPTLVDVDTAPIIHPETKNS
ncbi:thiamine pyrophosphate-binding protein [Pseudalkalibacillus caeni]|uniref:Thiamine pyrophosphate-binding protein n=1 Tax=Exobacillus caeni TaxID=2574798 RepID=A0A5R9EVV9_9BACL|nr:thiamine pyrophosphate-binding protein [Pseudalkalibacillus caeni]